MTTEAELVLMSLTAEELDDASRWIGYLDAHWKAITTDQRRSGGLPTDGPWHLLTAMRLAVIREQVARGGGEPWYAGLPTADHPAGRVLDLYGLRLQLNAIPGLAPRLSAAGVLEQACAVCGERKPLTSASFPRADGVWGSTCHACRRPPVAVYADQATTSEPDEWSSL